MVRYKNQLSLQGQILESDQISTARQVLTDRSR